MTVATSPTVRRVVAGQLCTGCGLCVSLSEGALALADAPPGYNRPAATGAASVSPKVEAIIADACPGAVVEPWAAAPHRSPYWGPYHRVMTGHATDEATRFQGSSGGAITALAAHALRSGLVDRVVHVVADVEQPTGAAMTCSTTPAEVLAGAGSRYVSSSPLKDIDRILADGGRLAFIGKPCDVSALRRLGRHDPRVGQHVALMLAFFCAGIPSRRGVNRVLSAMGVEPQVVSAFRYRGNGWPGEATATLTDGRQVTMSYEESWGDYLSKEVQFRCKVCPDAVGGVADIACADAWYGGETGYPTFIEQDGRSLIMTRTSVGDAFLDVALGAGAVAAEPVPIADVDLMQPSQAQRKRLVNGRLAALSATLQPRMKVSGLSVGEASLRAKPAEQLRNFLGTLRRIVLRRR